ncbi:hypothetical protein Esti_004856 [Eimeria stiedai]
MNGLRQSRALRLRRCLFSLLLLLLAAHLSGLSELLLWLQWGPPTTQRGPLNVAYIHSARAETDTEHGEAVQGSRKIQPNSSFANHEEQAASGDEAKKQGKEQETFVSLRETPQTNPDTPEQQQQQQQQQKQQQGEEQQPQQQQQQRQQAPPQQQERVQAVYQTQQQQQQDQQQQQQDQQQDQQQLQQEDEVDFWEEVLESGSHEDMDAIEASAGLALSGHRDEQQQQQQRRRQGGGLSLEELVEGVPLTLRMSDLPPLAFSRPSRELRLLAERLESGGISAEKQLKRSLESPSKLLAALGLYSSEVLCPSLHMSTRQQQPRCAAVVAALLVIACGAEERITKVYPFGTPVEVRSAATGTKFHLILRSVLGSGGQGIVLLQAEDARRPEIEFALKVFWIPPKRQRGVARDVERLKRRVLLEVAIARAAPKDVSLGVWSHLSHIVMPLDVVEPTSNFVPPPEDKARYWPQWVVFERFAGRFSTETSLLGFPSFSCFSFFLRDCRAVVRMHDMGMVHSDIKTQNFFVKRDGRILLGDYSLAHPSGHMAACTEGTATYLPPENLRCMQANDRKLKLTAVKDSWALGIVLFRIWCFGTRPYNVDDLLYEQLLEKLAKVRIEDLEFSHCSLDTPLAILHMIRLLLEPDPGLRPKPRDLLERHPAFTTERKALLTDTLGALIFQVNSRGLRLP